MNFAILPKSMRLVLQNLKQELELNLSDLLLISCMLEESDVNCNLQYTGPLSHYLHGEPLDADQAWKSNVLHVHEKCIEWYVPDNSPDSISECTHASFD